MPSTSCSKFFEDLREGRLPLKIASRDSNLAKAQVNECLQLLRTSYPKLQSLLIMTKTQGDRDKLTPLHTIENSDFFTYEVDTLVCQGSCHIAIHSAKDLPTPSPLPLVALTRCLHPADLLVYADHYTKEPFPSNPRLGSSSIRRGEVLKQLFPLGQILNIRGTIEERLQQLHNNTYDAIVLAKAAALRLGLSFLYSELLPPPYHPLQGRLALTAYESIDLWRTFLSPIHDTNLRYSI